MLTYVLLIGNDWHRKAKILIMCKIWIENRRWGVYVYTYRNRLLLCKWWCLHSLTVSAQEGERERGGGGGGGRERQTDRQTERANETESNREGVADRERDRERGGGGRERFFIIISYLLIYHPHIYFASLYLYVQQCLSFEGLSQFLLPFQYHLHTSNGLLPHITFIIRFLQNRIPIKIKRFNSVLSSAQILPISKWIYEGISIFIL